MKFKEYLTEAVKEKTITGYTINGYKFTPETKNEIWNGKLLNCSNYRFTSLEGVHRETVGSFWCYDNKLTTLKGGPSIVGGDFLCSDNELTSLEGGPIKVGGKYYCGNNALTSLKGCCSTVGGDFNCENNKLTSLIGCPSEVGADFSCQNNNLTSLEGCPSIIGRNFLCRDNNLVSFKDIHKMIKKMKGEFWCGLNPITSHVLGLLLIPGVQIIYNEAEWAGIINRYLGKGRAGLIGAQNEMIEAGLEEFAQL